MATDMKPGDIRTFKKGTGKRGPSTEVDPVTLPANPCNLPCTIYLPRARQARVSRARN
jgi:hypothetical protein